MIRHDPLHQTYSALQSGKKCGMQTMNDALYQLYITKQVTADDCLRASSDQGELMRMMGMQPAEDGKGAVKK
jgi:twitching motility protein PilT